MYNKTAPYAKNWVRRRYFIDLATALHHRLQLVTGGVNIPMDAMASKVISPFEP